MLVSKKPQVALIDGDSIAYAGGFASSLIEMRSRVDGKMYQILSDLGVDHYELFLENWLHGKRKKNFRIDIFKLSNEKVASPGYKGNREGKAPPAFLNEARQYMLHRWKAKIVSGIESEDMVHIKRKEAKLSCVICFLDKDLLQYPGLYYNYNTGDYFELTQEDALFNLWSQVCTGDITDNVPGIIGVGKKKAEKALCSGSYMENTVSLYKKHGLSYDYFIEQYNLIRLRDELGTQTLYPLSEEEWQKI